MRLQRLLLTVGLASLGMAAAGCESAEDKLFCGEAGCGWPDRDWQTTAELAAPADWAPAADRSNKYVGNAAAQELGLRFFFDTRFSGPSSQQDVLRRAIPVGLARAAKGQPTNLSCASCHNLSRAGVDTESLPGNVSTIGAAWADTNSLPIVNSAAYGIVYWNGRADSLWAQAISSSEGANMNGNRLAVAWLVFNWYRDKYNAVFPEHPLPMTMAKAEVEALVEPTGARAGQCKLNAGCPEGCREVTSADGGTTGCFPRFPLQGKTGTKTGCQPGDAGEPFGDAFDCMAEADRDAVTWVLVGWAKAIAAYEFQLVSKESPFDRWVHSVQEGGERDASFSPAAERGARLFVGKAGCVDCHNTPLLSDSKFYNVGVAQVGPGVPTEADCPAGGVCDCVTVFPDHVGTNCLPAGAADGLWKLRSHRFLRTSRWSDDPTDVSRKPMTEMDMMTVPRGSWRTPSLRDVALTAPYMHNGSLPTLEAVIEHYNAGGSSNVVGARAARIKPLHLTAGEKSDLVEFLKSLTGAPPPRELIVAPELPQ